MDITITYNSQESANAILKEFKRIIQDSYLHFDNDNLAISWMEGNPSVLTYFIMEPGETITIQDDGYFYFNGVKDEQI